MVLPSTQAINMDTTREVNNMMTLNEFSMFVTGVFWGIFIIEPVYRIGKKIYKNAKEAQNGNNR